MAPPARPPWERHASLLADLPRARDAWLARVLPLVQREPVDRDIAAALGVARTTWGTWRAWLAAESAAGRLPEWGPGPWPDPVNGARPGGAPRGIVRVQAERRHVAEPRIPAASRG